MKKIIFLILASACCAAQPLLAQETGPEAVRRAFGEMPAGTWEAEGKLGIDSLHGGTRLKPSGDPPAGNYTVTVKFEQWDKGPNDSHFNIWIDGRRFLLRDHSISWYDGKQEHPVANLAVYRNKIARFRLIRSGETTTIEINDRSFSVTYPSSGKGVELMLMNLIVGFEEFRVESRSGEAAPATPAASLKPAPVGTVMEGLLAEPGKWSQSKNVEFKDGILHVAAVAPELAADAKAVGVRDVQGNLEKAIQKVFITERGVDLTPFRGQELEVSVQVKGNVPPPPISWEGIRIVVNYATETVPYSDCYYDLHGDFDWKEVTFITRVPADLKAASLTLGLISDTGEVAFRDAKITVKSLPLGSGAVDTPEKKYTGRPHPLRGFNACSNILKNNLMARYAGEWNANIFKISWRMPPPEPEEEFEAALSKQFEVWDEFIRQAEANGAQVLLELYPSKWRNKEDRKGNTDFYYYRPGYAAKFVALWEHIAERYQGNRTIYAFELLNESVIRTQIAEGCPDYTELMEMAARAVNRIDPERTLLIQPEEWWGAQAFYKLKPIQANNVVYALHFYAPFALTHQNLKGTGDNPLHYPGPINGVYWDKETLRKAMLPVILFQKEHNAHILVSEFSCVRWAPGADRWLNDVLELFEEYEWDWMFHAVSEWWGWSPEFGTDPANKTRFVDSPQKDVLLQYFSRNR